MIDFNDGEEIDYSSGEEDLGVQDELYKDLNDNNSGEEIDYSSGEEDLGVQDELYKDLFENNSGEETDDNCGDETDDNCGEEIDYNDGEETDDNCGEETDDSCGEEPLRKLQRLQWPPSKQHLVKNKKEMIEDTKEVRETQTSLSVRREFEEGSVTYADKVSIHTGVKIATAGDTHEELPSAIVKTEDSDVSEKSLQPFPSPKRLQWNPSKQHLVTNVKEMKEDTKEVRETQPSLSVRREFEQGSVTSTDEVSIHTGENIATAGDTHEDLPSAIVKTEDSDVSEESLQPSRSLQRLQWTPSKQHLETNVKEMIEDTKEVREKQTSLSVRRESEQGSVTSADEVSIVTGENIATAGDTHEDLPSAIVQTVDSVVSEESLQVTSADEVSIHTDENIATAGDTQEDPPSAIVQAEDSVVSEESLQDLSENIGKCWKVVGRKLKLTEGQLENLEHTNHPTLQEKIYQMLLVWKRKRASAGTYVVLGDALKKAGRVDLQEDLLKTYQPT